MWSTLPDLPTELLLIIFQQLSNESLLATGKLCRRLNFVALPIFLERLGVADAAAQPVISVSSLKHKNLLTGLILNFSSKEIQKLVLTLDFRREDSFAKITHMTKNIQRFTQLTSRLSSIESACIIFHSTNEQWSLLSANVQKLLLAFITFLNSIIQKSCRTLQVIHSPPIAVETTHMFQLSSTKQYIPPPPVRLHDMKSLFSTIKRYILMLSPSKMPNTQAINTKFHANDWYSIPIEASMCQALTALELASDFLFLPPFSAWTSTILASSSITSLALSFTHQLSMQEFRHQVFPLIVNSLPRLKEIKLALFRDDYLPTVVENLGKFPLIEKVSLGLALYGAFPAISNDLHLTLPFLKFFTGSPGQASYLFSHNISCPNLSSINIVANLYFPIKSDRHALENDIQILNTQFLRQGLNPCISICLHDYGPPPNKPIVLDALLPKTPSRYPFHSVSRLTLEMPFAIQNGRENTDLLAWLSVFRGLTHLTLLTNQKVTQDMAMRAAVAKYHPGIITFNIVNLHRKAHYHWPNSREGLETGATGTSGLIPSRTKSNALFVCCDF